MIIEKLQVQTTMCYACMRVYWLLVLSLCGMVAGSHTLMIPPQRQKYPWKKKRWHLQQAWSWSAKIEWVKWWGSGIISSPSVILGLEWQSWHWQLWSAIHRLTYRIQFGKVICSVGDYTCVLSHQDEKLCAIQIQFCIVSTD